MNGATMEIWGVACVYLVNWVAIAVYLVNWCAGASQQR